MKVDIELFSDRFGDRVALRFAYNHDAKNAFKWGLEFPSVKWEGYMRAWLVERETDSIVKACEILVMYGYDCSRVYALVAHEFE